MSKFNSIEEALKEIRHGKMVVVVDDEDRENEGDLVMAADKITPEAVNFMASHGRGLICTPVTSQRAKALDLPLMVSSNNSQHETAFTVSVDAAAGGTGISAADRALTIRIMLNELTKPSDLARPGHIFPLIAKDGGVLARAGHTEAAVDLARLAGFRPMGVICEIINEDGTMARVPDLMEFSRRHQLKIITIKDLIEYRRVREVQVTQTSCIDFPNEYGHFKLHMFESTVRPGEHHIALVKGNVADGEPVLVRVHSECLTGDIFGSSRCDCGEQLRTAMKMIEHEGRGVILYMRQEGRGIGLPNKIRAYELQDKGYDTVEANQQLGFKADLREYGTGAQILRSLGVSKMKLLTNNPTKVVGLKGFDLEIVERVALEIRPNDINRNYLETKRDKMGHLILGHLH